MYLTAPLEIRVGEQYETLWDETRASGYVRIRVDGQSTRSTNRRLIDRRRKHDVEVVVDRVTVREEARSRIAGSVENALSLGRGVLRVVYPREDTPEPQWPVETHSQHFVCDRCGRSFEPLSPHNFSFNSALGWCPACEGLGVQTGTNPPPCPRSEAHARPGGRGALARTPAAVFVAMLDAFSRGTGIPTDVPFDELGGRHRRLIFHGTGEQWLSTSARGRAARSRERPLHALFRFQYKGLYPAMEEASRVSPALRAKLEYLVDEVECSVCGGSRLRDDAAAVRLHGRTIDELCRLPLGRLLDEFQSWEFTDRAAESGRRGGARDSQPAAISG